MTTHDSDDPVFAAFSILGIDDVSAARSASLRRQCLADLSRHSAATRPHPHQPHAARRRIAPAFAATWSALYVIETIRRAMLFYRGS